MTHQLFARFSIYTAVMLFPYCVQAQVTWVQKFDEALKQAQAQGKFLVIDVSASWCPPCQRMARDVYPNQEFIQFSKSQVFMLVDAETDVEGVRVARKFDVRISRQ
jgi:thiol-disulfide isomerase/thioredoxin